MKTLPRFRPSRLTSLLLAAFAAAPAYSITTYPGDPGTAGDPASWRTPESPAQLGAPVDGSGVRVRRRLRRRGRPHRPRRFRLLLRPPRPAGLALQRGPRRRRDRHLEPGLQRQPRHVGGRPGGRLARRQRHDQLPRRGVQRVGLHGQHPQGRRRAVRHPAGDADRGPDDRPGLHRQHLPRRGRRAGRAHRRHQLGQPAQHRAVPDAAADDGHQPDRPGRRPRHLGLPDARRHLVLGRARCLQDRRGDQLQRRQHGLRQRQPAFRRRLFRPSWNRAGPRSPASSRRPPSTARRWA